ncbi:MAG: DUF4010 domain-containing protein [Gemmatimonadales bacterium]|nr:DUF4010 domain-containing protein [Gemmatimonadales bacterium]
MDGRALAANAAVAALVGLAVGIERERSVHAGGHQRFAGLRTFFLLGLLGGLAGWMFSAGLAAAAALLLGGGVLFVVAAYVLAVLLDAEEADGTTQAAALVVLALATLAGLGFLALASGATAVVVFALDAKERLRALATRVGEAELSAAVQFAVFALAVLPLLPDRAIGPLGGINPRGLWGVVLLFMALNFAGYLARQAVGPERGLAWTGAFGGLVSSTAVTLDFSRRSHHDDEPDGALAAGVLAACTMLLPRVTIVGTLLAPGLFAHLLPVVLPSMVAGALLLWSAWPRAAAGPTPPASGPEPPAPTSPLRLRAALAMALAFQLALMLLAFVRAQFGQAGVLPTAALLGLTDMDALTVAMARMAADDALHRTAALAIGVGIIANTLVKLAMVLTVGHGAFRRRTAIGLVTLGLAAAAGVRFAWWVERWLEGWVAV